MKMRVMHGGGGLLVTSECTSIEQLESEVERMKSDLDQALDDAGKVLCSERGPSAACELR